MVAAAGSGRCGGTMAGAQSLASSVSVAMVELWREGEGRRWLPRVPRFA